MIHLTSIHLLTAEIADCKERWTLKLDCGISRKCLVKTPQEFTENTICSKLTICIRLKSTTIAYSRQYYYRETKMPVLNYSNIVENKQLAINSPCYYYCIFELKNSFGRQETPLKLRLRKQCTSTRTSYSTQYSGTGVTLTANELPSVKFWYCILYVVWDGSSMR